jgi:hypothetical protein
MINSLLCLSPYALSHGANFNPRHPILKYDDDLLRVVLAAPFFPLSHSSSAPVRITHHKNGSVSVAYLSF